jgi:hypothetical protein
MSWRWQETHSKTIGWSRLRLTLSWRPIFHLPRITLSGGGK